jgi:hypothetical protein
MNCYVPPRQLSGALESLLKICFFAAANFHAFLIHPVEQLHDGTRAFPSKITGLIQYHTHRAQQVAIPGLFQPGPVALDGVVFAIVRRVINQTHAEPRQIGKFAHAQQELAAPPIALRPVVQIDDELPEAAQVLTSALPPQQ